MAKDIDIGLPDGGEITVPAWSTEETQKQIYTLLKSMEGVDKDTVKKLEEAQRADDKNSKKEIEALKDLGKDLKEGMRGGFLGGLAAAAGAAGSALGTMGKVVGGVAGAVTVMGGALVAGATAATKFATGYTDALQPLVDSGMAFGSLGKQIDQSVVDLNALGFSSEEAAKLINNSSAAFLRLGDTALADFTTNMKAATQQGLKFGMAQDEATEYLLTELEERARSGIVERMNSTQFAAMQFQVLEDQISASKRLGKTVDEIADIQKDVMGDDRLTAVLNSVSGDQQTMLKELATNLSTYGLDSSEIADILSAEISGIGMEATEAGASLAGELAMVEGGYEGLLNSVGASMDAIRAGDREMYESATADLYANQEMIGTSILEATKQGLEDGFNPMIIQMEAVNTRLLGAAAALQKAGETGEAQGKETPKESEFETTANQFVRTAKEFDNAILSVTGAFTAEITRAQKEVVNTIGTMTKTIVDSGLVKGAEDLAKFMGNMAIDGIKAANDGLAGLAEDFVAFSQTLQQIYGEEGLGGVAEYITQAAMDNIVMPLAKSVGSIFTNPEVIAAAVAGIGTLMLAMRASVMGLPGVGTGGNPDAIMGGEGDDNKKGKGGRGGLGRGTRALLGGAGGVLLSGAFEAMELSDDLGQINSDLESGKIEEYEAKIAKTAETSEAVGGIGGAAGGAIAGAAMGSVVPLVGTAIGGLIGGAIGWYAGREGTRAIGEGLAEAVFTPEHIALENELAKIQERLTGDINARTRQQLEARQQEVQAELELIKPVEQLQPINPTNQPVMVTPPEETETESTPGPVSQDGTPTQEVKSNQNSETTDITSLEDLILMQTSILNDIKKNTKATVSGIGDIASS